jgi:hypothetical protein
MKKFLALMLILVMVSYASAGVINMEIKSIIPGEGSVLEVYPSDIVVIKIVTTVPLDAYDFDIHVTGPGTLMLWDGGPGELYQPYGQGVPVYATKNRQNPTLGGASDVNQWFGFSGIVNNSVAQLTDALTSVDSFLPGDLCWGFAIHCDGEGDVIVDLTQGAGTTGTAGGDSYGDADYGDLTIHQVPEPVTLSLLGLGGLALIRRRRA